MPFSLVLQGYPKTSIPVAHVQGPILQAMFLNLIQQVDPALSQRLHEEPKYRPYTLSPLGIVAENRDFQGYWLPRSRMLPAETLCYVRITFLDDTVFPIFSSYFLRRPDPTFRLGDTEFAVTDVLTNAGEGNVWGRYISYDDLVRRASHDERRIKLRFFTPTSFSSGKVDLPVPLPRLIFRSFLKRFQEFRQARFPENVEQDIDFFVGVSNLQRLETRMIKTKKVNLIGFTGTVTFEIHRDAPEELVFLINLLADYAFFAGTGKKTTNGMGQTRRLRR